MFLYNLLSKKVIKLRSNVVSFISVKVYFCHFGSSAGIQLLGIFSINLSLLFHYFLSFLLMSYRYCDLTSDDDFPYSCEYSHREIGMFRSMKRFVINRSHTVHFANVVVIPVDSQTCSNYL